MCVGAGDQRWRCCVATVVGGILDRLARAAGRRRAPALGRGRDRRSRCSPRGSPRVAPTPARTFGLQRSEVLGALVNGVGARGGLGADRGRARSRASPTRRTWRARACSRWGCVGLAGNVGRDAGARRAASARTSTSRRCCGTRSATRSARSAWWWPALVVLATGWNTVDPLVSILIAVLIAASSWRLLKEPLDVLMEAAPAGMDVQRGRARRWPRTPDVVEVHDLHVWTVTSGFPGAVRARRRAPGLRPRRWCARRRRAACCDERFEHPPHDAAGRARRPRRRRAAPDRALGRGRLRRSRS